MLYFLRVDYPHELFEKSVQRFVFSFLCICLVIDLYQCGLIDIYFTFGQFIWALFFISFKIKFNLISKSLFGGIVAVQVLSHDRLFMTSWIAAHKASLSFTISHNLLKLMSIKSVMPSDHLILYRPLLLLSYFLSIKIFSNESAFGIR